MCFVVFLCAKRVSYGTGNRGVAWAALATMIHHTVENCRLNRMSKRANLLVMPGHYFNWPQWKSLQVISFEYNSLNILSHLGLVSQLSHHIMAFYTTTQSALDRISLQFCSGKSLNGLRNPLLTIIWIVIL